MEGRKDRLPAGKFAVGEAHMKSSKRKILKVIRDRLWTALKMSYRNIKSCCTSETNTSIMPQFKNFKNKM